MQSKTAYQRKKVASAQNGRRPKGRFKPQDRQRRKQWAQTNARKAVRAASIAADESGFAKAAAVVATHWKGGAEAIIAAGVHIDKVLSGIQNEPGRVKAFCIALARVHVLTSNEAERGLESPKLFKLRAIGRYANLLRRKEIARFLEPSYTTIYQLIVLYEELPKGDGEQRVRQLVSLANASIERATSRKLTRKDLGRETRRAKQAARIAKKVGEAEGFDEASAEPALDKLTAAGELFDLVVLTPSKKDLKRLNGDYPDLSALVRGWPLSKLIAESAAVVIAFENSLDLWAIADKLPPLIGFPRLARELLLRPPESADITNAERVVTAERGVTAVMPDRRGEASPEDILELAARRYPKATRKLHVFAQQQTDGWTCLVGHDNWIKE
jgi:hypothetical protein